MSYSGASNAPQMRYRSIYIMTYLRAAATDGTRNRGVEKMSRMTSQRGTDGLFMFGGLEHFSFSEPVGTPGPPTVGTYRGEEYTFSDPIFRRLSKAGEGMRNTGCMRIHRWRPWSNIRELHLQLGTFKKGSSPSNARLNPSDLCSII